MNIEVSAALVFAFIVTSVSGGYLIYLFSTITIDGKNKLEVVLKEGTFVGDALSVIDKFAIATSKIKPDISGIFPERILEILAEYDRIPADKRKNIDYAIALFCIVLENEGVDFETWEKCYCDKQSIFEAFKRADIIIRDTLVMSGKSTIDKMFPPGEEYRLHQSFVELYPLV